MKSIAVVSILVGVLLAGAVVSNIDENPMKTFIDEVGLGEFSISEDEYSAEFDYFIAKYRKSYTENGQYQERFAIFKENYLFIQTHNLNKEALGFELGVNQMADLTNSEYQKKYLGYIPEIDEKVTKNDSVSHNPYVVSETEKAIQNLQIPEAIDWTTKGAVSSVKNQGSCSSDYAFSALSAIEGIYRITGKHSNDLSVQQILDCTDTEQYQNVGCEGGSVRSVYKYAHDIDLCIEVDYPYVAKDGSCKSWQKCFTDNYIAGYVEVTNSTRFNIYSALAQQPISVIVDAASDVFRFYKAGIFSIGCTDSVNHPMLAVGYGKTGFWIWKNNFMILKNTWSTDWGIKGYMQISTNLETGNGLCGLYSQATYPTL